MRYIIISALIMLGLGAKGQYSFEKNDFFEFGIAVKTLTKSDHLSKSSYTNQLLEWSNSELHSKEYIGKAVSMKYGKGITSFAHIVFDFEFAQSRTKTLTAIEYLDKEFVKDDIISFNMLNIGFGPRIKIIGTDGFELSVEGGGKAFHTLNAGDDLAGGYYARAIAGFNLNRRVQINAKYGYESTAGKYVASDFPAELAFHVKIY